MSDPVQYDIDSYEAITNAIRDLLNEYPGLPSGETIAFSTLGEEYGKAMFPTSGAIIQSDRTDVLGNHYQVCLYPFYVFYRAGSLSENRRSAVKEWLDNLGRWLERQPVKIGQSTYQLEAYPTLTGNRLFRKISRQTPAFLNGINDNNTEDWAITITAQYTNEF